MTEVATRRSFLAGMLASGPVAVAATLAGASPAAAAGRVRAVGRAFLPHGGSPYPSVRVSPGVGIGSRAVVMLTPIGVELAQPVTYQLHPDTDEFTIWSMGVATPGQWVAWAILAP